MAWVVSSGTSTVSPPSVLVTAVRTMNGCVHLHLDLGCDLGGNIGGGGTRLVAAARACLHHRGGGPTTRCGRAAGSATATAARTACATLHRCRAVSHIPVSSVHTAHSCRVGGDCGGLNYHLRVDHNLMRRAGVVGWWLLRDSAQGICPRVGPSRSTSKGRPSRAGSRCDPWRS